MSPPTSRITTTARAIFHAPCTSQRAVGLTPSCRLPASSGDVGCISEAPVAVHPELDPGIGRGDHLAADRLVELPLSERVMAAVGVAGPPEEVPVRADGSPEPPEGVDATRLRLRLDARQPRRRPAVALLVGVLPQRLTEVAAP